jgi:hypothetical protein
MSPSASVSPSASASASPSPGYTGYTRGDQSSLPANDNDLGTNYSAQDVTDVSSNNTVRVGQTASATQYAVHQYKNFVGSNNSCTLTWDGQTNVDPGTSTVYLQIYNRTTTTWFTVDSYTTSTVDTDFTLSGNVADLTNYKDASNVISCRIYQQSS